MKLLAAPDPLPALALMRDDGVLAMLLPEAGGAGLLAALVALEPQPDPLRRLAALLPDAAGAQAVAARLRLSAAAAKRLLALAAPSWPVDLAAALPTQRRALHHLGADLYRDLVLLRAAAAGTVAPVPLLALAAAWQPQRLPLKGRDVTALGVPPGPAVGHLLAALAAWWEDNDFHPDRAACLAELKRRLTSEDPAA